MTATVRASIYAFLAVLCTWAPSIAHASTIVCGGVIRDETCKRLQGPLPADAPVVFSLRCQGGGLAPPDAAATATDVAVDIKMLRVKSAGIELSGTFEALAGRCTDSPGTGWPDDGQLFRYTGMLNPGAAHEIHHPQTYSPGSPIIRFDVRPASQTLDAAVDDSDADASSNTRSGGSCAYGVSNVSGLGIGTAGLAMSLWLRRRRRR